MLLGALATAALGAAVVAGVSSCATCANSVATPSCGKPTVLVAADSELGAAMSAVQAKFPSFNAAQRSTSPHYIDSHPSGALATHHTELAGFGVTMIQTTGWPPNNPIDNASGRLDDPSLLMFDRRASGQDNWPLIGIGYVFALDVTNEPPPSAIPAIAPSLWFVHEAGYHHVPGDGGFGCASDGDLEKAAIDRGVRIDSNVCNGVVKADLKTPIIGDHAADKAHGRYWAVHVWFDPASGRAAFAQTDPWCRQSSSAVPLPSCAFKQRGSCP